MSTCHCCARRVAPLCSCVYSACRVCLFCLTHCRCVVRPGRLDPAKMAALDPDGGLDDPNGLQEAVAALSDQFELTDAERATLLPSGHQPLIMNRVGWSRTHLVKAGLLEATRRGYFRITERGRGVLAERPSRIDMGYLGRFPEYRAFRTVSRATNASEATPETAEPNGRTRTPQEEIEDAYQELRESLASEVLATVMTLSPERFERLVVDLLVRMGYGGTRADAGQAIGRSGDGGIDGIIKEDRLGLDAIYVQAKRWNDKAGVGRPEIQKFAGALQGHRARKGVFITTSYFTRDAEEYVGRIDSRIVLIDGETLARHMIDFGLGVTTVASYELKRIDSDYFVDGE